MPIAKVQGGAAPDRFSAISAIFRYSNTLGWNTFPVPLLTEQNKADLTACAEAILLAREAHFPATIADLYDPDTMPENLQFDELVLISIICNILVQLICKELPPCHKSRYIWTMPRRHW